MTKQFHHHYPNPPLSTVPWFSFLGLYKSLLIDIGLPSLLVLDQSVTFRAKAQFLLKPDILPKTQLEDERRGADDAPVRIMAGNLDRSVVADSASEGSDSPAKLASTKGFDGDDRMEQRDNGDE